MAYVTGSPVYAVADGQPIVYASLDGQEVWRAGAAPAPKLSDFYGIGPGQIPMDLRLDDSSKLTFSGTSVLTVQNDGGAAAAFSAATFASYRPIWDGSAVVFKTAASGPASLSFATPPDLAGTHILIPIYSGPAPTGAIGTTARRFIMRTGSFPQGIMVRDVGLTEKVLSIRWSATGAVDSPPFEVPLNQWSLMELRASEGRLFGWLNGLPVFSIEAAALLTMTAIEFGGSSLDSGRPSWGYPIGRTVSVITTAGATVSNLEPAVLLARQTIAGPYGIALS